MRPEKRLTTLNHEKRTEERKMEENLKNQFMYLAAWSYLKRIAGEQNIDKSIIDKLNRKNAETLMCDYLPLP